MAGMNEGIFLMTTMAEYEDEHLQTETERNTPLMFWILSRETHKKVNTCFIYEERVIRFSLI